MQYSAIIATPYSFPVANMAKTGRRVLPMTAEQATSKTIDIADFELGKVHTGLDLSGKTIIGSGVILITGQTDMQNSNLTQVGSALEIEGKSLDDVVQLNSCNLSGATIEGPALLLGEVLLEGTNILDHEGYFNLLAETKIMRSFPLLDSDEQDIEP